MIGRMTVSLSLVWVLTSACLAAEAPRSVRAVDKKLIEYGWDVPFPDFVRAHIREMEKRPFDGLIFKLHGGGKVLTPKPWTEAQFAKDYDDVRHIEWKRFTDNFVIMWAASDQDWFDDAHWQAIENNVRLVARAARLARCVGVCFDQEPYGTNPWHYPKTAHHKTKTFDEYQAVARRRGAQFVRAVESELPKPQILTFFQTSFLDSLLAPMDPKERAAKLTSHHYGLLPAFLNGMLDAAGPDTAIIDGNESAYYYTDRRQYFNAYHQIAQRALVLIDPALWNRYRTHVRVGQALYIDQYFGLRTRKVLGHYMAPEDQAKWFECNVYCALTTADRYVWCYSERMNWWKNTGIPAGCEQAIRSARAKHAAGQPAGIRLRDIVAAARERERLAMAEKIKRRTATVPRLPAGAAAPKIDGLLDDDAWKRLKPLTTFVPLACQSRQLGASTRAWLAYDTQQLYLAFRCEEPRPKRMSIYGEEHDDDVWHGDDLEVLVLMPGSATSYAHFMLNPRGVAWEAVNDQPVEQYDPKWQRAAHIGEDAWTAEMAIPWSALKVTAPKSGTKLTANLCRQRTQGGREWSSWSPMANGFLEPDLFGTWVLE